MELDRNLLIWLNFQLDPETNKLLSKSAARSGRTKRGEAEMRLKDHLRRFNAIATVFKESDSQNTEDGISND